jgi:hypothetical protein
MTPYALREQQIISDPNLSFATKLEKVIENIIGHVKENPRDDVVPLLHSLILLDFALMQFSSYGYTIANEKRDEIKDICIPFLVHHFP